MAPLSAEPRTAPAIAAFGSYRSDFEPGLLLPAGAILASSRGWHSLRRCASSASAEPLSLAAPARTVRFVALKVWATRLGIVGLVAMGFGTFALFITRSVVGLAIGAAVGVALSVRRALRITADDIDF